MRKSTLTVGRSAGPTPLVPRPFLFVVLDAATPLRGASRHALAELDEVSIGRGEAGARREGTALRLELGDAYVSTRHATLVRDAAGWRVVDGSKNGTFVNGARVDGSAALADGDVVETGSTFFVFRRGLPATGDEPDDIDSGELAPPADGLATLLPELAGRLGQLERIARSPVSVILRGETGTGKEVLARAIHKLAGRAGPFVAVNCGALPDALVESELFGSKRGAYSGAVEDRPGLVRSADRGTLLLDEVGDLPLTSQAALLRVIQEREVTPVGGSRAVAVDVRFVSASHLDLRALVAAKKFRADLEARLCGVEVDVPPLRERREDLGLLTGAILRRVMPEQASGVVLDKGVARAFLRHAWPKNIRELEQVLTSAAVLAGGMPVTLAHLPAAFQGAPAPAAPAVRDGDEELRKTLTRELAEHRGNLSAVARALGKPRKQVQRWVKRLALDPGAYRV